MLHCTFPNATQISFVQIYLVDIGEHKIIKLNNTHNPYKAASKDHCVMRSLLFLNKNSLVGDIKEG